MMIDRNMLKIYKIRRVFFAPYFIVAILQGVGLVGLAYCAAILAAEIFLTGIAAHVVDMWLYLMCFFIFVRFAARYLAGKISGRIREDAVETMRLAVASAFLSFPTLDREKMDGRELSPILTVSVPSAAKYYSDYLPQLVNTGIILLMLLLAVGWADLYSAAILLFTVPLLPVFMYLIGKWAGSEQKKQWKSMYMLSKHFQDVLKGLTTLKLFGRSKEQGEIIYQASESYRKTTMRVLRLSFLSAVTLELAATISIAVVAVSLGLRLLYGNMEYQAALFVLLLAPDFYMPLRQLGAKFHIGMNAAAGAEKILPYLSEKVKVIVDEPVIEKNSVLAVAPAIEFSHVSCTYPGRAFSAIKDVSLKAFPGNRLIIVGATGAGKSTLVNMLLGYAPVTSGKICLDGKDLEEWDKNSLHSLIAWLPQSPYIIPGTVRENLLLALPTAGDAELQKALEQALLWEEINKMPSGMEQLIGDGGWNLSPGQTQRLGLARVILSGRPILLIDEPASALDSVNEDKLSQIIKKLAGNSTVITITHRLGLAEGADNVVFLKDGSIAGQGQHKELLEKNVEYKKCLLGRDVS